MVTENKNKANAVILRELIILGKRESDGWEKVLVVVKWFNRAPVLDIRYWSPDRNHASKGSTLSFDELSMLCDNITSSEIREYKKEYLAK